MFCLRRKDIDLARRVLHISGQIQGGTRKAAKTKRSHRTIPLTADLVRVLDWHFQNQIEEHNLSAEGWNPAGLVFCSENGTPP